MKKGQIFETRIEKTDFPNKGIANIEDKKIIIKNGIEGQKVSCSITKKRKEGGQARLLEVLEKSPLEDAEPMCSHFGSCGGCAYQTMSYENQLMFKEKQVKSLIDAVTTDYVYHGMNPSPVTREYRNKMEFSFGDEYKDGPLALGLHKINSTYDIVSIKECKLVSEDFNKIIECALEYGISHKYTFYKKIMHVGFLRHLLIRRSISDNSLLVAIVTSSQDTLDDKDFVDRMLGLDLEGNIVGILHIVNDSKADVVQSDETKILYGQDYFYESLLGLRFKITPFSFFQTNSLGAEVLYSVARKYVGNTKDKVVFDLYSGTGTIAQMLAAVAKKVVGVEIVEEAVEAAKENAILNGLDNLEFIAGDVLKVLDIISDKPDIIVVDPPRSGVNSNAIKKIVSYGIEQIVYISCNPISLANDIGIFKEYGYALRDVELVDMFPMTRHVETVCVLSRTNE